MQTYALNLTDSDSRSFSTAGDLFVYESGVVAGNDAADLRIIVKPESGGEITLKPGQQFRLPKGESAMQWYVRAATPGTDVIGAIIIGAGEFDDANTVNTFKLDGTFTNAVQITNTSSQRVPVVFDPKQLLQIESPIMNFTNSKNGIFQSGYTQVIAPNENPNGIIIESVYGASGWTVIASNVAPTNNLEGHQIDRGTGSGNRLRTKIPAGMGIWMTGTLNNLFSLLWTAL